MSIPNSLSGDIRRLAYRVEHYLRLEATERLTMVTTYMVLAALVLALSTSAVFFLSTGLVKMLALWTGSEMWSYYMVGGFLLLLILLAFLFRKPLIENPFVRLYSQQLLSGPTMTERMVQKRKDEQMRKLAESLSEELDVYDDEEGGER